MLERALRIVALGALGGLLFGALAAPAQHGRAVRRAAVAHEWIATAQVETLAVRLDGAPDRETRDLLVALRRNAHVVEWEAARVVPAALELEPRADPRGGAVVRAAAPAGVRVAIGDALGSVDEAVVERIGATFRVPQPAGAIWLALDGDTAARATAGSVVLGDVVVLGCAGWEARFAIAALEERRWRVAARLALAPGLQFTQGSPLPLDTARHAAVIVLDDSAQDLASEVVRFVRAGGGVVIAGDVAGMRSVQPGRFGERVRPKDLTVGVERPLDAVAYRPVVLRDDGIPLAGSSAGVVIAARRVGAGRVVQVGYEDTWRWRMAGAGDAPRAHAAWWSDLVSAVARRTVVPGAGRVATAPYAEAVAALGQPAVFAQRESEGRGSLWPWVLALALGALFGEWGSRRLRGAP